MLNTGIEKRRHSRVPIELDYHLILENNDYRGKISDISLSGAYLAAIAPELPAGSITKLGKLKLKTDSGWETLNCSIVYVGKQQDELFPMGAGVAFCSDDEKTVSAIWNLAVKYLQHENSLF